MKERYKKQSIGVVADLIRGYYASFSAFTLKPQVPSAVRDMVATVSNPGLGDTVMLTDLPRAAHGKRPVHVWDRDLYFWELFKYNPYYRLTAQTGPAHPFLVDILRLRVAYNLGNGHQLQQFRRAWGLEVDLLPKGCLSVDAPRRKNRVIMHFEPSAHNSTWQRKYVHPRMRELYVENQHILENFIASRSDLEFVELGVTSRSIKGATHIPTTSIGALLELIQSGSWFIGIMSGPLHIATALGLKCIVVCNYPKARQIVLPTLKTTGVAEEEWYYPQNIHLHQEDSSPLVPRLSVDSLKAAFAGDVYPFYEDHWLSLITE